MNMVDEADDPTIDKPSKRRSLETPPPGPKRRKVGQYQQNEIRLWNSIEHAQVGLYRTGSGYGILQNGFRLWDYRTDSGYGIQWNMFWLWDSVEHVQIMGFSRQGLDYGIWQNMFRLWDMVERVLLLGSVEHVQIMGFNRTCLDYGIILKYDIFSMISTCDSTNVMQNLQYKFVYSFYAGPIPKDYVFSRTPTPSPPSSPVPDQMMEAEFNVDPEPPGLLTIKTSTHKVKVRFIWYTMSNI